MVQLLHKWQVSWCPQPNVANGTLFFTKCLKQMFLYMGVAPKYPQSWIFPSLLMIRIVAVHLIIATKFITFYIPHKTGMTSNISAPAWLNEAFCSKIDFELQAKIWIKIKIFHFWYILPKCSSYQTKS